MKSRADARPLVSVVVPTCRRPESLDRCIRALLAQDVCERSFEVIVADDAACDETRRQLSGWLLVAGEQGVCLRYVRNTYSRGPAAARNAGWRAARGRIIAFTDDDCIPSPGWLSAGLAAFAPEVDGVCGKVVVPLPRAPSDYQRNAAHLEHARFVTANCFYRRAALEAVGGFDERFEMAWREDSDLHYRLMAHGAYLADAPDALVTHPVRPAPWSVSVLQQRKSMYNALLYKKHPARYRQHIQAAPPWRYYLTVGALLGVIAGLLSRRTRLAGAAGVLWLGMTSAFCARRLRGVSHAPRHVAEMALTSMVIPPLSVFWRLRGAIRFRVWFF